MQKAETWTLLEKSICKNMLRQGFLLKEICSALKFGEDKLRVNMRLAGFKREKVKRVRIQVYVHPKYVLEAYKEFNSIAKQKYWYV